MTSPMFKSRFNTASIEPLVTMKIAPKQEIKIPSHPILLNLSPMIKKANTEVIEGPTLSIKEAFEAVVICKALKSMQLCKKIPKKAIASNTIKSCLLGIKAFLPSVKARTIKIIEDAIEKRRPVINIGDIQSFKIRPHSGVNPQIIQAISSKE